MPPISAGLNLSKSPKNPAEKPTKPSVFGAEPDSDSEPDLRPKLSQPGARSTRPPNNKLSSKAPQNTYTNLSSLRTAATTSSTAQSLDPNIYDYDNFHTTRAAAQSRSQPSTSAAKSSKYITSLLQSADTRKRDQQIAQEKTLARERENEGDEFSGKEKFVTGAYERQRRENERNEAEEKRRNEVEERKRREGGAGAFLRGVLDREAEKREMEEKAQEEIRRKGGVSVNEMDLGNQEVEVREEKRRIRELLETNPEAVEVNEDGQAVDKRQLLSAGLNVVAKPTKAGSDGIRSTNGTSLTNRGQDVARGPSRAAKQMGRRERQSKMIEDQLAEAQKRAAENEETHQRRVEKLSKSTKSEGDIGDARARYLARKKEREQQKADDADHKPP